MNKNVLIGIVLLLLLAGGAYAMKSKSPAASPKPQTQSQVVSEAAEFARAIESGKPTTCSLTKDGNTMEYQLKGKMMAANITTKVEDKTTVSHMINDGSFLYIWSDDQKQGSKMSLLALPSAPSSTPTPQFTSEADYQSFKDQGYTINCQPSSLNDSVFTPPSDVKFIDPTEVMKQLTAPGATGGIDIEKLKQQYGGDTQTSQ